MTVTDAVLAGIGLTSTLAVGIGLITSVKPKPDPNREYFMEFERIRATPRPESHDRYEVETVSRIKN